FLMAPSHTSTSTLSLHDALPICALRAAHRSGQGRDRARQAGRARPSALPLAQLRALAGASAPARARRVRRALLSGERAAAPRQEDRKSTRLNSSHVSISYAVFCL